MKPVTTLLLAVLLAGCTPSPAATTTSPPAQTPTPTASASSTRTTATVAQYASLVAKNKADYVKQIDTLLDSKRCALTSPGHVDVSGSIVCGAGIFIVGMQADTLSLTLNGAMDPTKPKVFIGEPPAEIKPLITETTSASDKVKTASQASSDCATADGDGCTKKLFDLYLALTGMRSQFEAWKPYGA
jgi:hypothetical protein